MFSLNQHRLYLCVGMREDMESFLPAAIKGGVDIVQLREKLRPFSEQRATALLMSRICAHSGIPFIVNDDPTLALEVGADGVHVGQDDLAVSVVRDMLGPEAIVGLSTHSTDEFSVGLTTSATYLSAGPISATPTKPGRVGVGLTYAVDSTNRADRPVYVTGGVTAENIASYVHSGLRHFVVVRAITEAPDPFSAARALRESLDNALSTVTIEPA
jgi:thiamine-phosphate pyrophosphorylase